MNKEKVVLRKHYDLGKLSYEIDTLHSDNPKRNGLHHGIFKSFWHNESLDYCAQIFYGDLNGVKVKFYY